MAILIDPIRDAPYLRPGDAEWLHLLVGDWQLLADLDFADLVLWFDIPHRGWVALAHVRPSTTQTVFHADIVDESAPEDIRELLDRARESKQIEQIEQRERSEQNVDDGAARQRVDAVPMVRNGRVLAVLSAHIDSSQPRMPSRLELTYRQCAMDLLRMCTEGLWPDFATPTGGRTGAPRVGDGFIRLDVDGVVQYASPNAVSAFRRLGALDALEGQSLAAVTTELLSDRRQVDEALPLVVTGRMPWRTEVENARGTILTLRSIPLRAGSERFGALVLCRDVTELRRRDAELVSKDATIREIHHRVKNNLQTVAALLRMQSRRMNSADGRAGLEQAMRRVATIALVHETLSQGLTQSVEFDDLIQRQIRLAAEVASPGQQVRTEFSGAFGELRSHLATPLALVINELVTNAVEHGLGEKAGTVRVTARRIEGREPPLLEVTVSDDGVGMGEGHEPPREGLGLQIVRTLVGSELAGELTWENTDGPGARVRITLPLTSLEDESAL